MNAKEFLLKKENIDGSPDNFFMTITFNDMYNLMESYYLAKSKEEEAINEEQAGIDAVTFAKKHELCNEDGAFELLTDGYMGCYYDHVYKLAAFGKEGG